MPTLLEKLAILDAFEGVKFKGASDLSAMKDQDIQAVLLAAGVEVSSQQLGLVRANLEPPVIAPRKHHTPGRFERWMNTHTSWVAVGLTIAFPLLAWSGLSAHDRAQPHTYLVLLALAAMMPTIARWLCEEYKPAIPPKAI